MKYLTYFVKEAAHSLKGRNHREMRCIWSLRPERILDQKKKNNKRW